jgi:SagB-type dehydrogenase family enzyme
MDWAGQPGVYKTYPGHTPIPLTREPRFPNLPLADLLRQEAASPGKLSITAADLSALFLLTYSLTARARHPEGEFYYRSVASAGALYPTEIYADLIGVEGFADGLYHISIAAHGLTRLHSGEGQPVFTANRAEAPPAGPRLVFFLTVLFFRSSWKYRDRAFRYHLLDTGHVLEHLILASKALALPYRLIFDFEDKTVGRRLGLDDTREVPLALCRINTPEAPADFNVAPVLEPSLGAFPQAGPVSDREVDYPLIRQAYQAGGIFKREVPDGFDMVGRLGPAPSSWVRLPGPAEETSRKTLEQAVFSRRSRRNFVSTPLDPASWRTLWAALAWVELEESAGLQSQPILAVGCLADRVEGIQPGFYLMDWATRSLGLAAPGSFTGPMAGVCLDQSWLSQAAVHFCFLTNVRLLDEQRGPRGYRYALMQSGRLGERLYLIATTLGLGCCGVGAFYDQEAVDLLGLNDDSRLLYLVAVGPVKSLR